MILPRDDTLLMAEAGTDPEAFAEIYRRHVGPILKYLRRRLGDGAAEDAATRVFMQAFAKRESYTPMHSSVLPWLYGIASHVIVDHHRQAQKRLRVLQRLAARQVPDEGAPAELVLSADLVRALRGLPQADRETFLLLVLGELSYEETAVALGVPVGTVRSRVARARSRLQVQLPLRAIAALSTPGELHA